MIVTGYDPADVVALDASESIDHPVLGAVHRLRRGGETIAVMSAIDLDRPTRIPAIDRPAALPPGTGSMLLNEIAIRARDAGVRALRYDGPYPTAALWASLAQCFRTDADEEAFTNATAARWAGLDRRPIPIDFAPAPFARRSPAPGVHVQVRDGLDRAIVLGAAYDRGRGVRRLVPQPDGALAAEVWFGDRPYARVATFDADGALLSRTPLPAADGPPTGQTLPPAFVAALASLVADLVPAPLADGVADALAAPVIAWGDAGPHAAIDRGDRILLHTALWNALAPLARERIVLALAEALAPIATARVARALTDAG